MPIDLEEREHLVGARRRVVAERGLHQLQSRQRQSEAQRQSRREQERQLVVPRAPAGVSVKQKKGVSPSFLLETLSNRQSFYLLRIVLIQ